MQYAKEKTANQSDSEKNAASDTLRLIKKYPNRRLYDTRTSSYITLADVKDLVLKHEQFQAHGGIWRPGGCIAPGGAGL